MYVTRNTGGRRGRNQDCVRVTNVFTSADTDNFISSEFARVFGIDFFSVISRGSQFKVESFMFRIAKPEGFVLISPSKSDVSFLGSSIPPQMTHLSRLENKTRRNVCL